MYCVSFNHKLADTKTREAFALTPSGQRKFLELVRESSVLQGCVVLMTCNRSEFYATAEWPAFQELERLFFLVKSQEEGDGALSHQDFCRLGMRSQGEQAVEHLYQVACGMESAVLGEVEIIHQVKQAYQRAVDEQTASPEIHLVFQGALELAAQVADQSALTHLPVSVGTLTTEEVLRFCGDCEAPHVLVVGATGHMGSIVRKDLQAASPGIEIRGTSRHREHGFDYRERYDHLEWADVVISATSSPHYTFLAQEVARRIAGRMRPLLFVDLAVPADIDREIADLPGCTLLGMDGIKALSQKNNEAKQREAVRIQPVIRQHVDEVVKNVLFREFVQNNGQVLESLQKMSAQKLLFALRDELEPEAFAKVLELLDRSE